LFRIINNVNRLSLNSACGPHLKPASFNDVGRIAHFDCSFKSGKAVVVVGFYVDVVVVVNGGYQCKIKQPTDLLVNNKH
jgi:hypothetical protein